MDRTERLGLMRSIPAVCPTELWRNTCPIVGPSDPPTKTYPTLCLSTCVPDLLRKIKNLKAMQFALSLLSTISFVRGRDRALVYCHVPCAIVVLLCSLLCSLLLETLFACCSTVTVFLSCCLGYLLMRCCACPDM